jgi:hypothetical protein
MYLYFTLCWEETDDQLFKNAFEFEGTYPRNLSKWTAYRMILITEISDKRNEIRVRMQQNSCYAFGTVSALRNIAHISTAP